MSKWNRDWQWWCAIIIALPVIAYYTIRVWLETVPKDKKDNKGDKK